MQSSINLMYILSKALLIAFKKLVYLVMYLIKVKSLQDKQAFIFEMGYKNVHFCNDITNWNNQMVHP